MKVVGLVSGGKDSCYAMMKCIEYGHEIVALANLMPIDESVDELDSYMYQTVGHQIVVSYAECMGLPLFRRRIKGSMRYQNLSYKMTPGDEVEDMLILLKEVKKQIPSITAVSSGAIASDYQRLRVESICSRLGLVSLAYLWKQDQSLLLQEMITMEIAAITVKVAAMGLDPAKHLGKEISYLQPHLLRLKESYGINVCGEGGEYETLTLDCPLFKNARIVLDEFQIILHSLDSIAPVGVLHPSAYHLEYKREHTSFSDCKGTNTCLEKVGSVCEVEGDCVPECEPKFLSTDSVVDFGETAEIGLHISKSKRDDTFSIGCWIEGSSRMSEGLQKDLTAVLHRIESQLAVDGFGWVNVLYIHLYIANMDEFSLANETYVRFITEEKCRIGVPSRSTIELPLAEVGLGTAYIEVLVANDIKKKVLHVQSISSWAPSCIGPYSQATLHNEILHMAGQLGLDPPTMTLCSGGPTAELEQALNNCEAVAECFNCSIAYSAITLIIYCSASIASDQRINIQERLETYIRERKLDELDDGSVSKVSNSVILYILVPDLPKRALVEIKPVLYAQEDKETRLHTDVRGPSCFTSPNHWGFQHSCWHESCYRKCVIHGKICSVILCITNELVTKICSDSLDCQYSAKEKDMQRITRFCLYLIDKVFLEDSFSWEDITNMRFYFPTSLCMSADMLSLIITDAFSEFAKVSQRISVSDVPVFNVVPVLGAGQSVTSMDDVITCEVFALKP